MMSKILYSFLILVSIFESGCGPFDHDNVSEYKVVGNYHVSSINGVNTLLYKDASSANRPGTGSVVLDSLDSVGWKSGIIVGARKSEYIIIDTASKAVVRKCNGFETFEEAKRQLGIEGVDMQSIKGPK